MTPKRGATQMTGRFAKQSYRTAYIFFQASYLGSLLIPAFSKCWFSEDTVNHTDLFPMCVHPLPIPTFCL